jgi:hypothetical protein
MVVVWVDVLLFADLDSEVFVVLLGLSVGIPHQECQH